MTPLEAVERAADRSDSAYAALQQAVVDAAQAGVPISDIARAARVQRSTIYRWCR